MKLKIAGPLAVAGVFVTMSAGLAESSTASKPPPMAPFEDIDHPTAQTPSVQRLLAFLPDVLAVYGDDRSITKSQIITDMGFGLEMAVQQGRSFTNAELTDVVRQLVEAAVNLQAMLSMARDDGYQPDIVLAAAELDRMRNGMGGEQFDYTMRMQRLSREDLLKRLAKKNTIDRWVADILRKEVVVAPNDVQLYYDENRDQFVHERIIRLSQICLGRIAADDVNNGSECRQRAASVRDRLARGESFDEIARAESHCPGFGTDGDIGYYIPGMPIGDLADSVAEQLFTLSAGEVSDIIASDTHCLVFEVTETLRNEALPLNRRLHENIESRIRDEKVNDLIQKRFQTWKRVNEVKILF